MRPSAELKDLMLRGYEAMARGDAAFWDDLLSSEDGVISIGTAPEEWWEGHDVISRAFHTQLEEMGAMPLRAGDIEAYESGDVGWTQDQPRMSLPDGSDVLFRLTTVFERQDGQWKCVQAHFSLGVPNH